MKNKSLKENILLKNKLNHKLEDEFKNYKKNLIEKSKEEILSSSYETTVKQEIKDLLEDYDMFPREVEALLESDDILNEYYYDWLKVDSRLGDSLMFWIDDSISSTVRRYYNSKQEKEDDGLDERE